MWNRRSSRALEYLTEGSGAPKVVRVRRERPDPDSLRDRPSDKILRIIQSAGWETHNDPELIDFLAQVEIADDLPEKLEALIAEVLYFCWQLDQEPEEDDPTVK